MIKLPFPKEKGLELQRALNRYLTILETGGGLSTPFRDDNFYDLKEAIDNLCNLTDTDMVYFFNGGLVLCVKGRNEITVLRGIHFMKNGRYYMSSL